jgi:CDP-4-dehydro-6-deoxyglucose reductase
MKATLVESRELAPEIRHFRFAADVAEFLFEPGQFVSLTAPVRGKTITRAYSLASTPSGNAFELCLNRVDDGYLSPHLFSLQPGDTIDFTGPVGTFVWRKTGADAILVATGTGIAPFRGMVQQALQSGDARRIHLIFGVRHEAHLLYRREFEALADQHANFTFTPTLSRPGEHWTGHTGHVQPHVFEALGERRDVEVYICGLKAMVDDVRARLKEAGLDRKRIIYEKYD